MSHVCSTPARTDPAHGTADIIGGSARPAVTPSPLGAARPIAEELGVVVVDYRCARRARARAGGSGVRPQGRFVRRGVFALKTRGRCAVADPNQSVLQRHIRTVAHPVAGGDDCTSLMLRTAGPPAGRPTRPPRRGRPPGAVPFRPRAQLGARDPPALRAPGRARAGGASACRRGAELLDETLAAAYARREPSPAGRAPYAGATWRTRPRSRSRRPGGDALLADLATTLGCSPFTCRASSARRRASDCART